MNYKEHYNKLIDRAKNREKPAGYTEKHHIIPRCLDGTDEATNIVVLTGAEHYTAHLLLVNMHPNHRGLVWAAIAMSSGSSKNNGGRSNNKLYAWLKSEQSKRGISEETKKKMSEKAKIKILTLEHREKIGASQKGKSKGKRTPEQKVNMSNAQKGRKLSPEHCEKMRQFMLGRKMPPLKPEWYARQIAAKKDKKHSEEWNKAIGKANIGRKHTQETKDKIRAARIAYGKRKKLQEAN